VLRIEGWSCVGGIKALCRRNDHSLSVEPHYCTSIAVTIPNMPFSLSA